jgi:hypothetical protein
MTPEFRLAVYKWSFEDKLKRDKETKEADKEKAQNGSASAGSEAPSSDNEERLKKEKRSITLQLQRLFAKLQLCDEIAVKTKDLTRSFGWEDADAFTQHDVQELCRVLFDALEKNFKDTEQDNLVNSLYQGKMKDYVQCKECRNESARTDDYLDIPLVIKGFGESQAIGSVEEAMHKFVTPEILSEDNQYNCEKCGKKVDAIKGLKFVKFPYLLTLQLKRFDFDYETLRRRKLNDRVTFPHYLDLNPFIYGNEEKGPAAAECVDSTGDTIEKFTSDDDIESMELNGKTNGKHSNSNDNDEFDFEGPPPVQPTPERPYIYELYSVLIHRGSTMGGHYYAYIKSFDTNKWYDFNDSNVQEISASEIKKAFGGDDGPSYSSYKYQSTSNAYMLMYRQIVPDKNLKKVDNKDVPQSARDIIENEKQQVKDKRELEEREKEMLKLKVYYPAAASSSKDLVAKELNLHKSTTFEEATRKAAEAFGLSEKWSIMGLSGVRLRLLSMQTDLPTTTYGDQEHKTLEQLNLFGLYGLNTKNMMLETRESSQAPFGEFNPDDMLFRVAKFDEDTNTFAAFVNIYVNKRNTFGAVKDAIATQLGVPREKQRIYKEINSIWSTSPPVEVVEVGDDYSLQGNKISEPEKYYVEQCEDPENDVQTPAQTELIRLKNLIEVKFNVPDKPGHDEAVLVDKNMTLKAFREQIQPIVGLGCDEFKIKRGQYVPTAYELVSESDTLSDCNIRDGMTLLIEKGRPLKEGEVTYNLLLFDLQKDSDNFTELFDVTIDENSLVGDAKRVIAVMLREEFRKRKNEMKDKQNGNTSGSQEVIGDDDVPVVDPAYLRLRELNFTSLNSKKVGKALCNNQTLKKGMMAGKRIGVQILSEPEAVTEHDLCVFVQFFKQSSFELTRKEDVLIRENISVDELKDLLSKKYDIPVDNVSFVAVDGYYSFYDDPEILNIPKLNWDKHAHKTHFTDYSLKNGGLLMVRDNTEALKELTKEEHDAIEKETKRKATLGMQGGSTGYSSFWNRKEKALKIYTE